MTTDYEIMLRQAEELVDGIPHFIANLANISALLYNTLEDINWAGFYLREGNKLVLGPFQGKPACIEIAAGKGVCGTALARDQIQRIENVHEFKGHIACDSASNSEIVIPIHGKKIQTAYIGAGKPADTTGSSSFNSTHDIKGGAGEIVAVLDIDSTSFGRFSADDEEGLLQLVRLLEDKVFSGRE